MFGGGEKKEKKDDEDRGDNSGSAKAQRAAKGDEVSTIIRERWRNKALDATRRKSRAYRG
jgi:hypothetical protein